MRNNWRTAAIAAGLAAITTTGLGTSNAMAAEATATQATGAGPAPAAAETTAPATAAATPAPSEKSIYDKIWGLTNLYNNPDNHWIEDLSIVGRQQNDLYYFHAHEGTEEDFTNRRTRIGLKAKVLDDFTLHAEVDLNLEGSGQTYNKITDAYVKWSPNKLFNLTVGKNSAKFTLDGATSSTQLITIDRSNVANNFWFTEEYIPGISVNGEYGNWSYNAGYFSSGRSTREFGKFNAGSFLLVSGGYNFAKMLGVDKALLRADYVYQDPGKQNTFTRPNQDVGSLNFQLEKGPWGLGTDLDGSKGYNGQPDLFGLQLQPSYKINDQWQVVARYSFINSSGDNGIRLARYENSIVSGKGDQYNEGYIGLNRYFYGQKLKWQGGVQYTSMADSAHDGGKYEGVGLTTGLRLYW